MKEAHSHCRRMIPCLTLERCYSPSESGRDLCVVLYLRNAQSPSRRSLGDKGQLPLVIHQERQTFATMNYASNRYYEQLISDYTNSNIVMANRWLGAGLKPRTMNKFPTFVARSHGYLPISICAWKFDSNQKSAKVARNIICNLHPFPPKDFLIYKHRPGKVPPTHVLIV